MRKVIGIGETVFDIIFKNHQPISAVPGGSTFNAVISLARSGVQTVFISRVANDMVGRSVLDFLKANGSTADYMQVCTSGQSPVSLAFLDEANNASYEFYQNLPQEDFEFEYPDIAPDDVVLYGSYFALNPALHSQVSQFVEYARERGAVVYYDVNFRPAHRPDIMRITPNLLDNLGSSDIVRGSREDFQVLYRKDDADAVYRQEISFYCKKFICTRGADSIEIRDRDEVQSYAVEPIRTVSTIGAGDNFNAGFIYSLIEQGIGRSALETPLNAAQWKALVSRAQAFSKDCCMHTGNYISDAFAQSLRQGKVQNYDI